jgi:MFS family permease
MTVKILMSRILNRFGYRGVLSSNTIILGLLLFLFASIGLNTPVWYIVLLAFLYGGFTSLQYTSMNTLVYADISDEETSSASSIASTMQQLAISFGVAMAGLVTTLFVPERVRSNAPQMIRGVHLALFILGGMTILSTVVFRNLRPADGGKVSQQQVPQHPGG